MGGAHTHTHTHTHTRIHRQRGDLVTLSFFLSRDESRLHMIKPPSQNEKDNTKKTCTSIQTSAIY
jgi:hypothetical protein